MNKLLVAVVAVVAGTTAVSAKAGPLPKAQTAPGARVAPIGLRAAVFAPISALPRGGSLPGLPMTSACQPRCGGGGPLDEPWLQYNLHQYPADAQVWTLQTAAAVQAEGTALAGELARPCGASPGTGCSGLGLVAAEVGVVASAGTRGLGLIGGGGIGPVPLPKLPEN